ncbi:MAG: NUDIX domain-containing protein [Ardenticatenaceae bacterium]|nr:NUDIX domain-containing protein [Ardenticatenaceae bacterium]
MTHFEQLTTLPLAQRWREQKYPAPIIVAIICDQTAPVSRYLLIRRNSEPYKGMWALVGGKWDFGEELATAVIREVKEETSLDTQFVAVRGLVSERLVDDGTAAHFLLLVCEVTAVAGTAREQYEGAVTWFTRAELHTLHQQNSIIPSDYAMLTEFAESAQAAPLVEVEMIGANEEAQLRRFERMDYS